MIRRRYDEFMKTLMQILKSIDGKKLLSAYIKVDKPMIKIMDLEEIDGEIYSNIKMDTRLLGMNFTRLSFL